MVKQSLFKSLYFQVLVAIAIGVVLGHYYPETGAAMKPLGDGFIKLIKMIIAPIIFCTIVVGIAGMEDMKKVGKTGGYAVLYFEVVSTIALIIGLIVVNVWAPGSGMNVDPATLDTKGIDKYVGPGKMQTTTDNIFSRVHAKYNWPEAGFTFRCRSLGWPDGVTFATLRRFALDSPDAAPKAIFAELINLLGVVTTRVHTCSQNIQPAAVTTPPYLLQVRIQTLPWFLCFQITVNNVMRNRP